MIIIIEKVIPSIAALTFLGIVIAVLKNPELADKWSLLLNRFIFWSKEKRERKFISSNLDYRITNAAKRINKESEGILPFGIRVKWRKPEEVVSYVQKNQVVVVLRKKEDLDENIVEACMAYIPKALLPKTRNIVDHELLETIDHYVIRKILQSGDYGSTYNYFIMNILDDRITQSGNFSSYFDALGKIDSIGFFTRVLLEEFKILGDNFFGTLEESYYKDETRRFLSFLEQLASRQPGDDRTLLFFNGKKIIIGIVLFAKQENLTNNGINAYIKRIRLDYDKGANRIFLFSYARRSDQIIHDKDGFVVDVKQRSDFKSLEQIEHACRNLEYLKLIKKEKYQTKDVTGKNRSAKYYIYKCIR